MGEKSMITGAIDFHVHPGPDTWPRVADVMEIAITAKNAGMGGLVFKCHDIMSTQLAHLVNKYVTGIRAYGGICLEQSIGGFNLRAVEQAIKSGAKVVWMPSLDARHNVTVYQQYLAEGRKEIFHMEGIIKRSSTEKLTVLENGKLSDKVKRILEKIAEANIIVGTGHMSSEERKVFIEGACDRGVKKIVVTHVNSSWSYCPIEEQLSLNRDEVFFEYAFMPTLPYIDNQDYKEVAQWIKSIGANKVIIGTDAGASWASSKGIALPHPVEAMAAFVNALKHQGITEEEIDLMARITPSRLLQESD